MSTEDTNPGSDEISATSPASEDNAATPRNAIRAVAENLLRTSMLEISSRQIRRKVVTELGDLLSLSLKTTTPKIVLKAIGEGKFLRASRRGQQPLWTKHRLFRVCDLDPIIREHAGLHFVDAATTLTIGNTAEDELLRKFTPAFVRQTIIEVIDAHEKDRADVEKENPPAQRTPRSEPARARQNEISPARIDEGPSPQGQPVPAPGHSQPALSSSVVEAASGNVTVTTSKGLS